MFRTGLRYTVSSRPAEPTLRQSQPATKCVKRSTERGRENLMGATKNADSLDVDGDQEPQGKRKGMVQKGVSDARGKREVSSRASVLME